ncbi:hypothetical protein ACFE04_018929 [Oxalis oulophora]
MDNHKKPRVRMLENFMKTHQNSFKSMFLRKKASDQNDYDSPSISPRPIPQLSPFANNVVARCSKILKVPTEAMQHEFDIQLPESVKELFTYARNFVEFCSFQTLNVLTRNPDYLSDAEFRRLSYDMMVAWEAPSIENELHEKETPCCSDRQGEGEDDDSDGWSLFYSSSTNMAVQVDDKKTVGQDAFARIAAVCPAIADVITVRNLFDALTNSSGKQLHFLIYEKYIRSLDKVIKGAKNIGQSTNNLQLSEGEIIIGVDGGVPTQPVFQHTGKSAWPGRLTLTTHALYFESFGVGSYDKAVKYDLATDIKQVIKPELTGPLGARIFDKAVMYKSTSVAEPAFFEFPEFKGNSRRDHWLEICLEILRVHRFIRKQNFNQIQESEVLSRAILGIFRCRAVREAFHIYSSRYKTLLAFNLAESLPGGDLILETLSSRLSLLNVEDSPCGSSKIQMKMFPVSMSTLTRLGLVLQKEVNFDGEGIETGDISVGMTNPLETIVKKSMLASGRVVAAQASVDQVKVEGVDTNVAVMKELLFPVISLVSCLQHFASWEDPLKSTVFLVITCYAIIWGWIRFILPGIFLVISVLMLWHRHINKGKPLQAFIITSPPTRNAVEQLLTLQDAVNQFEALIQAGNIVLLKMRALLFGVVPQATDKIVVFLVTMAAAIAFVPLKYLVLLIFLEAYTREFPYRKESSDRLLRRAREWWVRIPAAPVQLIKPEDNKKNK